MYMHIYTLFCTDLNTHILIYMYVYINTYVNVHVYQCMNINDILCNMLGEIFKDWFTDTV
jgi:hypothetical protein